MRVDVKFTVKIAGCEGKMSQRSEPTSPESYVEHLHARGIHCRHPCALKESVERMSNSLKERVPRLNSSSQESCI